MSKQILSEEFLRMQKLAGIITEAVEVPTWLKGKLEDVHVKPGQGSIFAKPIDNVLKLAQDTLDKTKDIDKIANSTGTLTVKSPGIGYNLVLPIEQAKKLPGAKETEVEKIEGPNKIKVPAITTTAPLIFLVLDGSKSNATARREISKPSISSLNVDSGCVPAKSNVATKPVQPTLTATKSISVLHQLQGKTA